MQIGRRLLLPSFLTLCSLYGADESTVIHAATPAPLHLTRDLSAPAVPETMAQNATNAPTSTATPPRLGLMEALQATLTNQPVLRIREQHVVSSRAVKQQAGAAFDTVLNAGLSQDHINNPLTLFDQQQAALLGIITDNQVSNVTTLDVGATRQYRNGIIVSPSFVATRTTDNIYDIPGINLATLSFQVTVPLLRGRGRSVVTAPETVADIEVLASLLDLNQTISTVLTNTATGYWSTVAAAKILSVARQSEQRGVTYLNNVQTLIAADRVPEVEIHQVRANLAVRVAARIAAEQNLIAAQQQLALAMGLSGAEMRGDAVPSDDFPTEDGQALEIVASHSIQQYLDTALEHRADYLAAKKRETERQALMIPARNATAPQVNLVLSSGYSSLDQGKSIGDFLGVPGRALRGPDFHAGITYHFAPSNNAALANLTLAESNLRQAQLVSRQTSQNITSAVITGVAGVRNAAYQLRRVREAVAASVAALDGEREKYRLGAGQIVDVLTLEDRLTSSQENAVNAELGYALALTQLRFATGTIVEPGQATQTIDRGVFMTVPVPGPAGQNWTAREN